MSAPSVWPVIHLTSYSNAMEDIAVVAAAGCAGVFIIQMDGDDDRIDPLIPQIQARFPQLMVGVNYLSLDPLDALARSLALGCNATWTDRPGVRSDGISDEAKSISRILDEKPEHLFFGSVAFKYQRADLDPAAAALAARSLGMIPTTSGSATGKAPTGDKLSGMRGGANDLLAVASGITPNNVSDLGRFVSHILVATGVSKVGHDRIDLELLNQLMARVQSL